MGIYQKNGVHIYPKILCRMQNGGQLRPLAFRSNSKLNEVFVLRKLLGSIVIAGRIQQKHKIKKVAGLFLKWPGLAIYL